MRRTLWEVEKILSCQHWDMTWNKIEDNPWVKNEEYDGFKGVYGFRDCCICKFCGVSCGEEMNAGYISGEYWQAKIKGKPLSVKMTTFVEYADVDWCASE